MTSLDRASARMPSFVDPFAALWRLFDASVRRSQTTAALEALDDRMLKDIGLARWKGRYVTKE